MKYSKTVLPLAVVNKSAEAKAVFLETYSSLISKGQTEEESAKQAIAAMQQSITKAANTISTQKLAIKQEFLGKNALTTEDTRNLVSADFDSKNRLVLIFDTGEKIVTKPIQIQEFLDQQVTISEDKIKEYIKFNILTNHIPEEGDISWDSTTGTLNIGMNGVKQQVGLESFFRAYNNNTHDILNGHAVCFNSTGLFDTIGATKMLADGSISPLMTLGIATQDIPIGQFGYITNFGEVHDISTTGSLYGETWVAGDILYVSPTISGGLTKNRPIPPQITVAMAVVTKVDAVNGILLVSPRLLPQIVYGSYYSNAEQTIPISNTAQPISFNNSVESFGITQNVDKTSFSVSAASLYVIDYCLNVRKTGGSVEKVWLWIMKNGVDIPNSASTFTVQGLSTEVNISGNFSVKLNENDTISLMLASDSTGIYLHNEPALLFAPASPSARVTIFQSS